MALLMEHFAHWNKTPVPHLFCVPGIQPSAGHTVVGQCICGMNIPERTCLSKTAMGWDSADLGPHPSSSHHNLELPLHFLGLPSAPDTAQAAPALPSARDRKETQISLGPQKHLEKILSCFSCSSFHTSLCMYIFFPTFHIFLFLSKRNLCITNLDFLPAATHWLAGKLTKHPIWFKA